MNKEIEEILACLIDEIKDSGSPAEATIYLLARYEGEYDIVKQYFKETNWE